MALMILSASPAGFPIAILLALLREYCFTKSETDRLLDETILRIVVIVVAVVAVVVE